MDLRPAPANLATLQAGRGIAALLVVLCHATDIFADVHYWAFNAFAGVFRFGYAGVEFFFVLSGFIMLHVHRADLGRRDRLPNYLGRRLVRIYPVYWLVMLPFAVVHGLAGKAAGLVSVAAITLVGSSAQLPLPVAWTLFHEVLFYALFGVLFVDRRVGIVILCAWFAVCAAKWELTPYPLATVNLLFGFGLLAALGAHRIARPRLVLVAAAVAFVIVGLETDYLDRLTTIPRQLAFGLAAAIGVAAAVAAETRGRLTPPRFLVRLGDASYVLYLIHVPLLIVVAKLWPRSLVRVVPANIAFVIVVAFCVAAGIGFHRAIERPLLRRLRVYLPRSTKSAATPA